MANTVRTVKEVVRTRLIGELEAALPRLVVIAAPAGYGKSTVARQIASRFDTVAICDCANLESERQFWYAVLEALRVAQLASPSAVSSPRAAASGDPSLDNVLALLREAVGSLAIVFENAQHAFADPLLRRSLQHLVAASPRSCTTLICTRTGARMQLSKFAAPHEMLVWRARDLAFDAAEIAAAFAEHVGAPDLVHAVAAATSGWPVAVLFLQRFVSQTGLSSALRRFSESNLQQLHEYLVDEVLAELTTQELAAILVCSIVPDPTAEDVSRALPDAAALDVLDGLLLACPLFARIDAERFQLHPLLQAAVTSRFAEQRQKYSRELAQGYEVQGRFVRAAQIYHAAGRIDPMARALIADNTNPDRTRTIGYSALLATLDAAVLAQYPVLQALTIYWRRFRVDPHVLREQTELVWEALKTSASLELRANVGSTIARIMYETGAFVRAEALLRTLEDEYGGIPAVPASAGQAYVARTLGCIAARSGRIQSAERYFKIGYLARPGTEHVRSRYFIERALIERLSGNFKDEQRLLALALESAQSSQAPVQAVCALAESAFGAWFRGDDRVFRELLARLDIEAHANGYSAFTHLCAIGSGRLDVTPNGTEQPNWLACTFLVAAASAIGPARARYAAAAKTAADESNDVFLQVLASIAVARTDGSLREQMLSEAANYAAKIEVPIFARAMQSLVSLGSAHSLLQAFCARFDAGVAPPRRTYLIEILARRILRGQTPVDVGEKQIALLVALARERRTYARAALTEELWPLLSEAGAREALNSCVYRIRSRLGANVVIFDRDAYGLGEDVHVDLRELEQTFAVAQRRAIITDDEREHLEAVVKRWAAPVTDLTEAWEFLSPVLTRAAQMTQTIAERLALDALQAGIPERALVIARDLIASDPCDEQARSLAIRALLAKGDRSMALMELRNYQKVLWHELEVQPSVTLTTLLHEAVVPQFA